MGWTGVEINGLEVTLAWLRKVGNLPRLLDKVMRRWSRALHRNRLYGMENYADERPGQVYVRTGDLGAGHELSHPGLATARFRNLMDYAFRVLGDSEGDDQAWMHKNRWWVERKVIEDAVPDLIKMASKEIEKGP